VEARYPEDAISNGPLGTYVSWRVPVNSPIDLPLRLATTLLAPGFWILAPLTSRRSSTAPCG
jgi:hypothetical protein